MGQSVSYNTPQKNTNQTNGGSTLLDGDATYYLKFFLFLVLIIGLIFFLYNYLFKRKIDMGNSDDPDAPN